MPTIKVLNQRRPGVKVQRLRELQALYEGDEKFELLLQEFLPQRQAEPPGRYELRKKEAEYRNYVGPIIDYFAALLFSNRVTAVAKEKGADEALADPGEFYGRFKEDCDLNGADMDAVMKDLLTQAMVNRCAWLLVEHMDDGGIQPETMKQYEERKLGDCWVTPLDPVEVLDWDYDAQGLEWVMVHSAEAKRVGPDGTRDRITERWKYITRADTTTFEVTYDANKKPADTDEVPRIGEPVPHKFGRVPVVCLELKHALWVAARLKTPQLAHFRLTNALNWGMTQTCYAMPVFTLKEGTDGKFRPPAMGAGYGIYIGQGDQVDWLAPPTAHLAAMAEQIVAKKDELYRIAHQMALGVENSAAAVGRSAESKGEDNAATRVILGAFSRKVKETIELVYDLISTARGENRVWSVEGLDDIPAVALTGLVDIMTKVDDPAGIGGIPSRTFKVQVKSRLAEAILPDVDQETKQKIRQEIKEGIEKQEEDDAETLELGRLHVKAAAEAADMKRKAGMDGGEPKPRAGGGGGAPKPGAPARGGGRRAPAAPPAT